MAEIKFNSASPVVLCDKCNVIVFYIHDKFTVTPENVQKVFASIEKSKVFCDECEKKEKRIMSKLAQTIVFDIVDELTDIGVFDTYIFGLSKDERQAFDGALIGIVDENLERETQLEAQNVATTT